MKVEYDDNLNALAWEMVDFMEQSPAVRFNNIKAKLRDIIQEWVDAHPGADERRKALEEAATLCDSMYPAYPVSAIRALANRKEPTK